MAEGRRVKVFSTPTCPYCLQAKAFLTEKKVSFDDVDVSKDAQTRDQMIEMSGQMGVPVIVIDGKIIVGFNKQQLEKLLSSG